MSSVDNIRTTISPSSDVTEQVWEEVHYYRCRARVYPEDGGFCAYAVDLPGPEVGHIASTNTRRRDYSRRVRCRPLTAYS